MPYPPEEPYIVKPVFKALKVLVALGDARRPMGLTELCHQVRLPKTTVYRYLQTLAACGFVLHDAGEDLYRPGPRLFELGQLASSQLRLRDVALPEMHRLRDRFNETVNLALLDGQEIVYLEMVESHHSLRMQATLGSRDPAYATAVGKAMLAYLDPRQLRKHLPAELTARTARTITSPPKLRAQLSQVRDAGYAVDDGENEDGARCVGAPVFEYPGRVVAALSVSAPASRLRNDQVAAVAQTVVEAAAAISRQLGYDAEGRDAAPGDQVGSRSSG